MRCKLGSWWVPSSSPLIQFYGCTCSTNCTGCTVVCESICYKSMPMSWGTERQSYNEVLCISCDQSCDHRPPSTTLKHSTASPVLDPARTKRLPIALVKAYGRSHRSEFLARASVRMLECCSAFEKGFLASGDEEFTLQRSWRGHRSRERLEEAASTTGFLLAPRGVRSTGARASA